MLRFSRSKLGRPSAGTSPNPSSTVSSGPAAKKSSSSSSSSIPKRLWSPLGARSSSTPRQVISGSEMSAIVYRRLPLDRTIEAEEDVSHNLVLHREFVSKKASNEGSLQWDDNPEARSATEQRFAKASIARGINEQRKRLAQRENESYTPVLDVSNSIEGSPGAIETVRYIFDDARMKYCDRFQRHYAGSNAVVPEEQQQQNREENLKMNSTSTNLAQDCQALLEACAILYGCESDEGRESWYEYFLKLDRASLEELEERRMNQSELLESFTAAADEKENAVVPSLSKINEDDEQEQELAQNSSSGEENENDEEKVEEFNVKDIPSEFADIYASYQAYCSGKSPTFGNATTILNNADITEQSVLRKFKYRKLMELLVDEQPLSSYPSSSSDSTFAANPFAAEDEAVEVALQLNNELQSLKLYGLRVGESVKEALMLQETRGHGGPDVNADNKPFDMSPMNPDRVMPGPVETYTMGKY